MRYDLMGLAARRRDCAGLALVSLLALPGSVGAARAEAAFVCRAWPTQTCHFALVKDDAVVERFVLRRGEQRVLAQATPGDQYMMSVNFDPPPLPDSCSRAPRPEAKRSYWCRLRAIAPGENR